MHGHQSPSWERIIAWSVVAAISLQILAGVLPRLLPAIVVLAVIYVIVRIVVFHTRD